MSYDLVFSAGRRPLTRAAFESYFSKRRWWQINNTERGAQAWYSNEDTGVYFSFDWSDDDVSLNVNYYRPSMFGLEAAEEVTAFVEAFAPTMRDPQSEGMGEGPYSRAGFLRGWNAGNNFAHRAILQHQQVDRSTLYVMGRARIESLWRWNLWRERAADYLGTIEMLPCFVPKIMLAKTEAGLRTLVVWDGTIPILLPNVDDILVPREAGIALVERAGLDRALAEWRMRPDEEFELDGKTVRLGQPAREVVFEEPPPQLTRAIGQLAKTWAGEGIEWDQLHDQELVDAAR